MPNENFSNISQFVNSINIEIQHIPTKQKIKFASFLISFTDSYKLSTTPQNVYGRMDPIINYKNTARVITFSIAVPAASLEEAKINSDKISSLIKFQYPVYSNAERASGIFAPPMCNIRFNNMITEYGDYLSGFFAGVDFTPVNETGYFIDENSNIYAKEYKLNLSFTVLHTKSLGWTKGGKEAKWKSGNFPYNKSIASSAANNETSGDIQAASAEAPTNGIQAAINGNLGGALNNDEG